MSFSLRVPRWSRGRALAVAGIAAFALVGWQGVSTVGLNAWVDSGWHRDYAQYFEGHWAPPSKAANPEYATPPLFHIAAIGLEHAVRALPSRAFEFAWNPLTRGIWLAFAVAAAAAMTSTRNRVRTLGVAGIALVVVWGLDEAVSLGKTEPWSAGEVLSFAACVGLILVTGLIAREVWPERPRRALAAMGFLAAYPVVLRMGVFFHPEMLLAFLVALATFFLLRAARRGWPDRAGWALGAACGAAALTRQSALIVLVCVYAFGLAVGGRPSHRFFARAALVTVALALPWWAYAYKTWHNPLQSNLEPRASLMLDHQPASFYVSFPLRSLVLHPHRAYFDNELLPKLHADLWSDWVGTFHPWNAPSRVDRVTASSQSVLGFIPDGLALVGLFAIAIPAGVRALRRRAKPASDVPLGFLGLLAVVSFAAFVVELVRFPQRYGDPIKSSYLLFTAPCWAIFSVAAWIAIARGRARVQVALSIAAALYAVSYGVDLGAAFTHTWVVGPPPGVDLRVSISESVHEVLPGQEVDYSIGLTNAGGLGADSVRLVVRLPVATRLIAAPFVERGSCRTTTRTVVCRLDSLEAGESVLLRFGATSSTTGVKTTAVSVRSTGVDWNSADNRASLGVAVVPPPQGGG